MISSGQLQNRINPQDYTKEDINNITAKGYYGNPNAMTADSKKAYVDNQNTKALSDLQISGRQTIDPNNPAYKKAAETQANADKILHDETGVGYQCTEVSTGCTTETTTKTCQQSNHQNIACYRLPKVEVMDVIIPAKDIPFSGSSNEFIRGNRWNGELYFNFPYDGILKSFSITFHGDFTITLWGSRHYWIYIAPAYSGRIDHYLKQMPFSFSFSPLSVEVIKGRTGHIVINGREYAILPDFYATYNGVIEVPATSHKEYGVRWQDTCTNLQTSACVKTEEVCTEAGGTRNISGVDVSLDCWRYDLTYSCGYNTIDSCKPFADKCNFLSQRCIEEDSGFCLTYEKTYSCIQENCDHKELRCGDPQSIMFTQTLSHGTANDFAKVAAGFAGVTEAGNDLKKNQDQLQIFKGRSHDCGEAGMGLYDCCDGGGNILHHCSESEKALKEARDKSLATYVGRYCARKVLGVCLVHRQTWCVFESKLMRIIQEQGRANQLHISFGSGENPNCTGLTPEQLQQINFDQIDFSEIYADLAVHHPNNQSIEEAMSNKFKTNQEKPQYMKKDTQKAQDQPLKDEDIKYIGA
jgi:conjugal transfer mating pair stabilization protein TraN